MRTGWGGVAAALVLAAGGCAAEAGAGAGGQGSPESAAEAPAETDFTVRLDSERNDPGQFELTPEDGALRIATGPAGIAYRAEDRVQSGDFRVSATFVQFGAPLGYREAYGIFVGGRDLEGPDLEYTYLLVRPTGDFLVKRRIGATTETIVDWTAHQAVQQVAQEGDEPVNTLAVEVVEGETLFTVNGTTVHAMPATSARPHGVVGLRANHRLDIRVTDFVVQDGITES